MRERLFLTMIKKITEIKKRAYSLFKGCIAEAAFISLLSAGVFCVVYVMVILAGRLTGAHTAETVMPFFSSCPPLFLISMVLIVLSAYIASAPLFFGVKWFFWQVTGGKMMPVSSIFACYGSRKSVLRCIKIRLAADLRKAAMAAALTLIGAAVIILAKILRPMCSNMFFAYLLHIGCALVVLCLVILYLIGASKYAAIGYIMADDPDLSTNDVLKQGKKLAEKKHAEVIMIYICMGGWLISCLLVFPALAVYPLMQMVTAVFIRDNLDSLRSSDENAPKEGKEHILV